MFKQMRRVRRSFSQKMRMRTASQRALPDFIIIGAQKAGTTFLYHVLSQHPDVLRAAQKEVHFFDFPQNFRRGENGYRAHFPLQATLNLRRRLTGRTTLTGEASPYYLFHPLSASRAAQLVPHAKLIVSLRDPVERAYSHYKHNCAHSHLSFEEALATEDELLQSKTHLLQNEPFYSHNHRVFSYRTRGEYLEQIQLWERFFPRSQMLILSSEKLFKQTPDALQDVFAFLDLVPWQANDLSPKNENRNKEKMKPETRRQLRDHYAPHNRRLYEYLGTDFGWDD